MRNCRWSFTYIHPRVSAHSPTPPKRPLASTKQMKSTHFEHCMELIDGGSVLIPHNAAWLKLTEDAEIDGLSLGGEMVRRVLRGNVGFCMANPTRFTVALFKPGPNPKFWMHCVLFRHEDRWRRVHIERLQCGACGWRGMTATPLVPDLYLGVPNKAKAIEEAAGIPVVPCPSCGGALPPRHPIWVEEGRA